MSRIRINAYGISDSVNSLTANISELLGHAPDTCMRIFDEVRSRFRGAEGDLIVNWGSGRTMPSAVSGRSTVLNPSSAVNTASNKASAFDAMKRAGVSTVEYTESRDVALGWLNSGSHVFCRTQLRGHSGAGIIVASTDIPRDLGNVEHTTSLPESDLYTKGVSSMHREYRVHVFKGQIILVQQKRRRAGYRENENYSSVVRNHGNGWVYGHLTMSPPITKAYVEAIKAVKAVGLDFGAVDVVTRGDDAWVLEVNTAPGLSGSTTLASYADAIVAVFRGTPVRGIVELADVVQDVETTSFQVGDRVRISSGSTFYGEGETNPEGISGTVISIADNTDNLTHRVLWDNERTNFYTVQDLVPSHTSNMGVEDNQPEGPGLEDVYLGNTPDEGFDDGYYYVLGKEDNPSRFVGQYCKTNRGFWDCGMELHHEEEITVYSEVTLD